jgi:hypothetical protein
MCYITAIRIYDYHVQILNKMKGKFVKYEIESITLPTKVFRIDEIGLILYTSKRKLPKSRYSKASNYLGLIIYELENELTTQIISKRVVDLVRFINFILPDYVLANWLIENTWKFAIDKNEVCLLDELPSFLEENVIDNFEDAITIYSIDFNQYNYPFNYMRKGEIDFKGLFLKYHSIPIQDVLRDQIELFSYLQLIPVINGSFYDNDNLQKSLIFILAEQIVDESIVEKESIRDCPNCDKKIKGQKGMGRKVTEFVEGFEGLDEDSKVILKNILNKIGKIRHTFFHKGKYTAGEIELNKQIKKFGKGVTIEQDLEFSDGRFSGFFALRNFLQVVLISKLYDSMNEQ